jgi:predicted transcriptional regulator
MVDWQKVGFVVRSRHRQTILRLLGDGPRTPSALAKRLSLSVSHTSQLLSGMGSKGIVVCLTPNMVRGRLYALTPVGKEILSTVRQ